MRDEIKRLLSEIESACGTPDLTDEEIREIWHEALRRSATHKHGYDLPRGRGIVIEISKERKVLTDMFTHEKYEIPYTDEWVRYTILNYLRKYDEHFDKNGNRVHFIRR